MRQRRGADAVGAIIFGRIGGRELLILLVGAAGFEPATWSTQNSRATRLRYTPPGSDEHESSHTDTE